MLSPLLLTVFTMMRIARSCSHSPPFFSLIPLTLPFVTCKHICCLYFFFFPYKLIYPFAIYQNFCDELSPVCCLSCFDYFPREFFWGAVKSIMFKSAWCLCQELASASSTSCPWHTMVPSLPDVRDDGMEGLVSAVTA